MAKFKLTQKKSIIGATGRQKQTIKALGLRRINHTVEHEKSPSIEGMIEKVKHLIEVEVI